MVNGVTAWQLLHRKARVRPGPTIVVHGASGGVGTTLVQLARHAGVRVIGTAAVRHHDALRTLGAEPVDYHAHAHDLTATIRRLAPGGVHAVFDHLGGPSFRRSFDLLTPPGAPSSPTAPPPSSTAPTTRSSPTVPPAPRRRPHRSSRPPRRRRHHPSGRRPLPTGGRQRRHEARRIPNRPRKGGPRAMSRQRIAGDTRRVGITNESFVARPGCHVWGARGSIFTGQVLRDPPWGRPRPPGRQWEPPGPADVARLSPLGHPTINLQGR